MAKVEVYLVVDSNGDYGVGIDRETACEDYQNRIQPVEDAEGMRAVEVQLEVPLPLVKTMSGSVPVIGEPGNLTVK